MFRFFLFLFIIIVLVSIHCKGFHCDIFISLYFFLICPSSDYPLKFPFFTPFCLLLSTFLEHLLDKVILSRKRNAKDITRPDPKLCHRAIVTRTVEYWYKRGMWTQRIEQNEDQKSHSYHIISDRGVSRNTHCFKKNNNTNYSLVNRLLNSIHSSLKETQMPNTFKKCSASFSYQENACYSCFETPSHSSQNGYPQENKPVVDIAERQALDQYQ